MSTELLYTSAPRGLRHGSRGFCTVLTTAGMPINVIARLEAISSYRHLFPPDSQRAGENPVSWAHQRLNLGGQVVSVLSRVAAYGTDYSGRTNKIAHHVTVDPGEMPAAGPAWLIRQRSFLRSEWLGQCESPPAGPVVPRGDQPPRLCSEWKSVAGDAGWGGVVAEAISQGGPEPLWVIYPLVHQGRLLELMDESISLLPVSQRWRATFNTFAANIPPDVQCKIRFVPVGTEEAKFAASGGKAIDLTKHQSITTASQWVERARGAIRREAVVPSSGGGFTAVQEERENTAQIQSAWSSVEEAPVGPPPPPEPPSLPPELINGKSAKKPLIIVAAVLATIVGLGATWTFARMMAGLPILPGNAPSVAPAMPEDIIPPVDEVEAPVVAPVPVLVEALELKLHYDKKQILGWASGLSVAETPSTSPNPVLLPNPVSLRGGVRIKPIQTDDGSQTSSSGPRPSATGKPDQQSGGLGAAKLIAWGGQSQSLGLEQDLVVQTTLLTEASHPMKVVPLPVTPGSLGPTKFYWNRETGDLIGIAELDFSDTAVFLAAQRDAYRNYGIKLAEVAQLADGIDAEASQLPTLMKDAVDSFVRRIFPGAGDSRIESLIRRGSAVDVSGEATTLTRSLESKVETMTKRLDKAEQLALVKVIGSCGQIAQASKELHAAFMVLEKGQSVEVPDLKFLESETVVIRRVPLNIHFSW